MRKRAICSILAAGVLLLAQATAALATQPTDAAVTRSMPASLCALLLLTHPGHTSADCVTHHSVRIEREPGSKVGFASPQAATLAFAYCVTITGSMWNIGWSSTASQRFCVTPNVVVSAIPGTTQCRSSWWVQTTWCGVGVGGGWYADGGDNVYAPTSGRTYLRVWMNAAGAWGVKCWGYAFC